VASEECLEDSDCNSGEFMSKLKTKNFEDALDDYAWMKTERHNNLSNINKIVKRLMKKGSTSVETQTDQTEVEATMSSMNHCSTKK
jgi:hypothetical protein